MVLVAWVGDVDANSRNSYKEDRVFEEVFDGKTPLNTLASETAIKLVSPPWHLDLLQCFDAQRFLHTEVLNLNRENNNNNFKRIIREGDYYSIQSAVQLLWTHWPARLRARAYSGLTKRCDSGRRAIHRRRRRRGPVMRVILPEPLISNYKPL